MTRRGRPYLGQASIDLPPFVAFESAVKIARHRYILKSHAPWNGTPILADIREEPDWTAYDAALEKAFAALCRGLAATEPCAVRVRGGQEAMA